MPSRKIRFLTCAIQSLLYQRLPVLALGLLIGPWYAGESNGADQETTKPVASDTKPPVSGVSIKLKLLPGNQSKPKETDNNEAPSETSSKKKATDEKSDKKVEPKDGSQSTSEPPLTLKPELKPAAVAKKDETGTVELKLTPPKSNDEQKKPENPAESVERSSQLVKAGDGKSKEKESTGTIEVSLQTSKDKDSAPTNGKVTIELLQPPARRTISDSEDNAGIKPTVLELQKSPADARKNSVESFGETNKTVMPSDPEVESKEETQPGVEFEQLPSDEASGADADKTRDGDPGDPGDAETKPLPAQPGDLPLDQDSQPFDAPAAKATEGQSRFRPTPISNAQSASEFDRERDRRIEAVLAHFRTHPENVVRRGPWALMHAILPYGVETEVIAGKRKVNAIGWLCYNGIAAKQRMFQPTQSGFRTNVGPGVQGHEGQFLAILAQSHVQADYPIQVGNKKYTIRDLIKYEMATCREKSELTFKLIGFTHYLQPQQTWRDNRGRSWSIEKLVAEELAQPINGEACGGTHRLMGLTCAVVTRQDAGLPITGHFERAQKFLNDFVEYTFTLQNPDGSFSTEWFERRADEPNLDRKVQTTGHILEWLVYTLPDDQLKSPEIEQSVDFLLETIGKNPGRDWPIGPRGHSLRALSLYKQRAYKSQDLTAPARVATEPAGTAVQR